MARQQRATGPRGVVTPAQTAKTVTTTLGKLVGVEQALGRLAQQQLPGKVSYHVAKMARLVGQEAKHFHDTRQAAIKELGEERDATDLEKAHGHTRVNEVTPANVPAFNARMDDLAAVSVTIDWAPIHVAWLETLSLTPNDLLLMEPVLTEEAPPKA